MTWSQKTYLYLQGELLIVTPGQDFFGFYLFVEPWFLILEFHSVKPTEIKVIDFGSACMEGRTVYSYIQVLLLPPYKVLHAIFYLKSYRYKKYCICVLIMQGLLLCIAESLLQVSGSSSGLSVSFMAYYLIWLLFFHFWEKIV